jgi:hypothetical protein
MNHSIGAKLNQAMRKIESAGEDLKKASRYLTWKAVGIYALVAILPLLALLGWDRHLVRKIEKEQLIVNQLDAQGGKAQLSHCGTDSRFCVQIDTKAGEFVDDYRVVKGY